MKLNGFDKYFGTARLVSKGIISFHALKAGLRGKSGPPRHQNASRQSGAVHIRRAAGALTEDERDIRAEILAGLIADSGGEAQISNGLVECDQ